MDTPADYIETNRRNWNERTPVHLASEFYDLSGFKAGSTSLKEIELALLGDVRGKSLLHLQCHFGQDTLSLARMGAEVTGVDLSDKAIEAARGLAEELHIPARFIQANVYDLPALLDERFDIVFTSYGTIGWLADIDGWAAVVARFLKPGGRFVFVEFHPYVWMYDDTLQRIQYPYWNREPIIESAEGTYTDRQADIQSKTVSFNHGLGEVVTALVRQGLRIQDMQEYDFSPYNIFPGMVELEPNRWRVSKWGNKVPLVYSLVCGS